MILQIKRFQWFSASCFFTDSSLGKVILEEYIRGQEILGSRGQSQFQSSEQTKAEQAKIERHQVVMVSNQILPLKRHFRFHYYFQHQTRLLFQVLIQVSVLGAVHRSTKYFVKSEYQLGPDLTVRGTFFYQVQTCVIIE